MILSWIIQIEWPIMSVLLAHFKTKTHSDFAMTFNLNGFRGSRVSGWSSVSSKLIFSKSRADLYQISNGESPMGNLHSLNAIHPGSTVVWKQIVNFKNRKRLHLRNLYFVNNLRELLNVLLTDRFWRQFGGVLRSDAKQSSHSFWEVILDFSSDFSSDFAFPYEKCSRESYELFKDFAAFALWSVIIPVSEAQYGRNSCRLNRLFVCEFARHLLDVLAILSVLAYYQ